LRLWLGLRLLVLLLLLTVEAVLAHVSVGPSARAGPQGRGQLTPRPRWRWGRHAFSHCNRATGTELNNAFVATTKAQARPPTRHSCGARRLRAAVPCAVARGRIGAGLGGEEAA
jgi:hypothetical protein